jgi:transposase
MPMLEGQIDVVIGVDTHRDTHAAALLDPDGGVRATLEVPSDRAGHACLLRLADEQAGGRRVWALEGTGCYGAGLTRFLVDQGEGWSRSTGPSGPEAATGQERRLGRHPGRPRGPGPRPPHHTTPARPPGGPAGAAHHPGRHRPGWSGRPPSAQGPDRHRPRAIAGQAPGAALAPTTPRLRRTGRRPTDPVEHRVTVRALVLTAQRALTARQDAKQLGAELRQLVTVMAPALLAQPGIGPITAASC